MSDRNLCLWASRMFEDIRMLHSLLGESDGNPVDLNVLWVNERGVLRPLCPVLDNHLGKNQHYDCYRSATVATPRPQAVASTQCTIRSATSIVSTYMPEVCYNATGCCQVRRSNSASLDTLLMSSSKVKPTVTRKQYPLGF